MFGFWDICLFITFNILVVSHQMVNFALPIESVIFKELILTIYGTATLPQSYT